MSLSRLLPPVGPPRPRVSWGSKQRPSAAGTKPMYAFYGFCLHNFLLSLMIAEVDEQNAAGEKSIAAPRPTSPSSFARVRRRIPRDCARLFPYLPLEIGIASCRERVCPYV